MNDDLRERGKSAPEVVRYLQSFWIDTRDKDRRGAPREVDLFLRIGVDRGPGVDAAARRAGVCFRPLGSSERITQEAFFAQRRSDGLEEWQARICLHAGSPGVAPLYVWYEDGRGNLYYDDNAGQMHVVLWKEGFEVVRHEPGSCAVELDDAGVRGVLSALVADLEYRKELGLVWTTDHWATHQEFGTGDAPHNQWRWVRDGFEGFQHWELHLDIPGDWEAFEYAIVYRHARVPGAVASEFWADNGHRNFLVRRDQGRRD